LADFSVEEDDLEDDLPGSLFLDEPFPCETALPDLPEDEVPAELPLPYDFEWVENDSFLGVGFICELLLVTLSFIGYLLLIF
jgi:hypothetical protein